MDKQLDYDSVSNKLSQHGIIVDGAEVHGILCGMLCGGMSLTDQKWLEALSETINQGDTFNDQATFTLNSLFNQTTIGNVRSRVVPKRRFQGVVFAVLFGHKTSVLSV